MSRQAFVEYEPAPTSGAETFVRPSIHRLMLEDFYRTESFRNALTVAVHPGMVVLDIGAGTGILSCFAVQAGAEHVYAIESSRFVKHTRRIVERNGMADKITVIEGDSPLVRRGCWRCDSAVPRDPTPLAMISGPKDSTLEVAP